MRAAAALPSPLRPYGCGTATRVKRAFLVQLTDASRCASRSDTSTTTTLPRRWPSSTGSRHWPLQQQQQSCRPGSRAFSSRAEPVRSSSPSRAEKKKKTRPQRKSWTSYAVVGALVAGGIWLYSDQLKHGFQAVKRTGRVVGTLAVCIQDYRKTLNYDTLSPEDQAVALKACHKRCAERTLHVLEKNGSIFIKLGQHLSSMGYLLPLEWTTTFVPLQDRCPVSSIESIGEMFIADTGHPISELFSDFEPSPIGAASLAQVHLATLRATGEKVAVKVQHPALAEWVPLDLALTRFTFSMLKRFFPEYDFEWLSREMDLSLPQELDFEREAENANRAREYFKQHSHAPLIIPKVMWARKRILVMEYITGHRPDDLEYLDANGIDREEVSAAFAHIFNEMIFGDNAPLHCDPHGGNIAIRKAQKPSRRRPNFEIILYDHGLYRDISRELRRNYAKLWLAVIDADESRMREYARKVAGISDEQFPLFASAITGRDYGVLVNKNVASSRTASEKENITGALGDGMLLQLVEMLSHVPRIILLILKTNDLTRSLDENLHTRQGPILTFLILARYATRTVFEEQLELIRESGGLLLHPCNVVRFISAWMGYLRVQLKLSFYENLLWLKSRLASTEASLP